uniref:hypothetical protein n=1 Tax=Algoriphagus sp. TaxID=1872435 RepID=UPI0040481BB9
FFLHHLLSYLSKVPNAQYICCNRLKLFITIDIQIDTPSLWEGTYSEYQEFLYQFIHGLYTVYVTGRMGYRKISQYLNTLGLVTPYGNTFTNSPSLKKYSKSRLVLFIKN